MTQVASGNYNPASKTRWETNLLKIAMGKLVASKFARTEAVAKGDGTIQFSRFLRPAVVTSSIAEGATHGISDAKQLTLNKLTVTPAMWGDVYAFSDRTDPLTFISKQQGQEVIAGVMAQSLDRELLRLISTRGLRHRIDAADTTHQVSGTATGGSTTTLADTSALSGYNDDDWNGGFLCGTAPTGPNYDICRQITDYANTGDTATFTEAFPQANTTATKYRVTIGTSLAAGDKLTTVGLMDVQALHNKLQTVRFPGGLLRGFIDAAQERDLMDDTSWLNHAVYDGAGSQKLNNYGIARWCGIELMIGSEIHRETEAGAASATGVVYVAPIFGADAYSVLHWGNGGSGDFGVKFLYKDGADSGDLLNSFTSIGWKALWAGEVLRATSVIGLMTGATSQNVLV
jgi:hypothetical protein